MEVECENGHVTLKTLNNIRKGVKCNTCTGNVSKYTHDDAVRICSGFGYTLLSRYVSSGAKMRVICKNGHSVERSLLGIKSDSDCAICSNTNIRKTYAEVKKAFESKGYELLESTYKNNSQRLKVRCPVGHIVYKQFGNFLNGSGCQICAGKVKYTDGQVKRMFDNHGFQMTGEYINNRTPVEVICKEGHRTKKSLGELKYSGCYVCGGKRHMNVEEFKKVFSDNGFEVMEEPVNYSAAVKVKCIHGHITDKIYYNAGSGCATCAGWNRTTEDVGNEFLSRGYELLDDKEYTNNKQSFTARCEYGHIFQRRLNCLLSGLGCPECFTFKNEEECRNIMEDHFSVKFTKTKPKWLNSLELDGYNDELKIAFEYNGQQHYDYYPNYFHKKNGIKDFISQICRDKLKRYLCEENGVRLISIPYHIQNRKQFILDKFTSL